MKKAAVINDISGLGRCSLTAALPVLSVMGIQACPLPTAILTNQTGYDSFILDDYTRKTDLFTRQWKKLGMSFDGIMTGYMGSEEQTEKILDFIDVFKTDSTLLLVDPVMADNGEVYPSYTAGLCEGIKRLAARADILTPNLTELCILAGTDCGSVLSRENDGGCLGMIEKIAQGLLSDCVKTVIVTGIRHGSRCLYNGVFSKKRTDFIRAEEAGGHFSGTGDLFASVVMGSLINGEDAQGAVKKASEFISLAALDTVKAPHDINDGINFEKYLKTL